MDREFKYWFTSEGRVNRRLVPSVYEGMDVEVAKRVRDELSKAIEEIENE